MQKLWAMFYSYVNISLFTEQNVQFCINFTIFLYINNPRFVVGYLDWTDNMKS